MLGPLHASVRSSVPLIEGAVSGFSDTARVASHPIGSHGAPRTVPRSVVPGMSSTSGNIVMSMT